MKRKSFAGMQCSVAQTLDVVGDPWTLLIVREALFGTTRFDDFQGNLDIPRTTLAARLGVLVDHKLMERHRYQDHPKRYEYRLTEKGLGLKRVIITLLLWGDRWSGLPEPPVVFYDGETSEPLDLDLVDVPTGRRLEDIPLQPRWTAPRPQR